jgi:hypothetical protein
MRLGSPKVSRFARPISFHADSGSGSVATIIECIGTRRRTCPERVRE